MSKPNGHLYVTRAATLEYQRHCGGGFEESRRDLTTRLLLQADMDDFQQPGARASYLLEAPTSDGRPQQLRVRVQREGPLLVVTKLSPVS